MNIKTLIAIVASLFIWSSGFVAIRIAIVQYSPGGMALLRFLVAGIILVPYYFLVIHKKQAYKISTRDLILCFLTGASISAYIVGINIGEQSVSAAMTSFVVSTEPIIVTVLAGLFLSEPITTYSVAGLLVSLSGVFLIYFSHPHNNYHFGWGVLMILIATTVGALYSILQKPLLRKYSPSQILPWYMWAGALVLLPYFPAMLHDIHSASLGTTAIVIYLGVFVTLISLALWSYVLSHISAGQASAMFYGVPFLTLMLGWLVLREPINLMAFSGGCLAMAGAIVINIPAFRQLRHR